MSNPLSTFAKTQHKLLKLSKEELAFKAGIGLRFPWEWIFRPTMPRNGWCSMGRNIHFDFMTAIFICKNILLLSILAVLSAISSVEG